METGIVKFSPELLALFAAGGENGVAPFSKEIFLQDITVAGTGYCDEIDTVFKELKPDCILRLQRDPKNQYDELAVGVYYGDTRIGWVPRKQNMVLAHLMDAGKNCCMRVKEFFTEQDCWKHIEGQIIMIE
jgi:hypothetical protein